MTTGGWPAASADDWMALVEQSLRGRGVDELSSLTRDGIEIRPLYADGPGRPEAAAAADPKRPERGWDVRQHHEVAVDDGLGELRRSLEADLAGGATSVELNLPADVDGDCLDRLLGGVDVAATPLALAPHAGLGAAEALLAVAALRGAGLAPGSSLGLDPVGEWARSGRRADCVRAAGWAASAELGPGVRVFHVDAVRYADAAATEAQALGWATATGIAYLRALVQAGLDVDAAASLIGFRMACTADQFLTIAALRAARVMWARAVTASGGSPKAARQYQHAVTASHMYSRRDPWVNLLRGASAALAAGVAGADAVTVLPFDHASGAVDDDGALARRLARNTQLLLLEESQLARPADPAGGSFYVESLTEQLASEGWRVLQDVEASSGIEAAIDGGALAAAMEESWQRRLGGLRTRREPVTGVSEFPLLNDPAPASAADPDDAEGGAGLPARRLAEPFEDLRDAADRHHVATGDRPAMWVAALGSAAAHSARTSWTRNLLAAGGVEARGATGVDSPVAAAADFAASGLAAAVITGTDDMYRLRGTATVAALSDAGAAFVALSCDPGTPAELLAALRSAGVKEIWHDDIDVVAALERLHRTLGVA
ncbi:MAG: methylmalonyl-CoA mutase [Acidimicrobiaceae bacterium]|nr:methylmalonyl-CoA mutase family protein [Acidimicrobiaceae bacterium]MXZ96171.1 methylmalonyl-CoA mutase [Acidimicrobiaceae bacterium]MYF43662.1 methylmalonyl-CoA mutase [Acidimicrobiaceae bacterium]